MTSSAPENSGTEKPAAEPKKTDVVEPDNFHITGEGGTKPLNFHITSAPVEP